MRAEDQTMKKEVSPMEDTKLYLLAELTVLPGFLEEVKAILREALIPTLQEPGCAALYETARKDDPRKLVFFEAFNLGLWDKDPLGLTRRATLRVAAASQRGRLEDFAASQRADVLRVRPALRQSQRDSGTKPRVARNELPWEISAKGKQPQRRWGCFALP